MEPNYSMDKAAEILSYLLVIPFMIHLLTYTILKAVTFRK